MKNIFIGIISALMICTSAMAVNTDGLSKEQIIELEKKAQEMKSSPSNISQTVRTEAKAWSELGSNVATAIVSAAREVGVAADEFSRTDLGKIVTFIVVYKIIGNDLLGIIFGCIVLLSGSLFTLWLIKTDKFYHDVKYEYKPVLNGLFQKKVCVQKTGHSNERLIFIIFSILATIGISSIAIFK